MPPPDGLFNAGSVNELRPVSLDHVWVVEALPNEYVVRRVETHDTILAHGIVQLQLLVVVLQQQYTGRVYLQGITHIPLCTLYMVRRYLCVDTEIEVPHTPLV